jgi:hypothetical protein
MEVIQQPNQVIKTASQQQAGAKDSSDSEDEEDDLFV